VHDKTTLTPALRFLIAGACIVVIAAGMKAAAPILNILLLAFLLAQSVIPFPMWLIRKRFKAGTAVLLTIIVLLFGGLVLISLLGASVSDLIQKLPVYQEKLVGLRDRIMSFMADRGIDAAKLAPFDVFPPKSIIALFGSMLGAVAGAMGNGLVLLLVTIFTLIEFVTVQVKLNNGEFPENSIMHRFGEIGKDTQKYVAITGIAGLVQATINTGVLLALGVDFAVTFGVFFFFCNFIPAVGFLIAIVPPFFITLLDHGLVRALYVAGSWWFVNLIFDNVIRPKFMKKGLNIPIFLIIVGLIIWAWVLGPVGAILAIPLTMAVIRLVQYAGKATKAQSHHVSEK
jgi:AI-2 transport protein TqsA